VGLKEEEEEDYLEIAERSAVIVNELYCIIDWLAFCSRIIE
jgi:hypothetical protein